MTRRPVRRPLRRLFLPGAMAAFLLLSLAYWWLENVPHELFGTAMFALAAWHVHLNRRWFPALFRGRYDARRAVTAGLHLLLVVNMLILLGTSIVISKSLFSALPIPDSIYLREVHWFSAYWAIVVVGLHLGLHWDRVMTAGRTLLGLRPGAIPATALRLAALCLAAFGIWSFSTLGVWNKLTFTYSIDVWNFRTSVAPFFGHWAGVAALPAIVAHYGTSLGRRLGRGDRGRGARSGA